MSFLFYIQKPGSRKWDCLVLGSIVYLILKFFYISLTFFHLLNSSLPQRTRSSVLQLPLVYTLDKYDDGKMELDGYYQTASITFPNTWGSLYISAGINITLPVTFKQAMGINISFNPSVHAGDSAFTMISSPITNIISCFLLRGTPGTVVGQINFHITGY